jgi:hypothetical protein
MTTNINFMGNGNNRNGLLKTGRIGGNERYSANQYELKEHEIMVPRPVANSGSDSLSIKIKLD